MSTLSSLPSELILQIGVILSDTSPDAVRSLAQVDRLLRASSLGLLYSAVSISSRSQLEGFASLLGQLKPGSWLDPSRHITALQLGPEDTLASASSASHYFSSINSSGGIDKRLSLTAEILGRCCSLRDLVIWDGLVGSPSDSLGLWSLHPEVKLRSLALPFLWRGGINLPSPATLPALVDLQELDIVCSGLTIKDLRILAEYSNLKVFRWYYRPLGLIDIELLFSSLSQAWKEEGKSTLILLAAKNGKLAQIEGWLEAQPSSLASETVPISPVPHRQNSHMPAIPESGLDQNELDFLESRRRAGRQGFVPSAAPQRPPDLAEPSSDGQVMRAPPIFGGFPSESTEDHFARRMSERDKWLNQEKQDQAWRSVAAD